MRDRRRHRRIKLRACAVCGVSFQSARSDALYCSSGCRQKAHRASKAQVFLTDADGGKGDAARPAVETQEAILRARVEVRAHPAADLDHRLGQIDSTIDEAAKRGRTNAALSAIDGQRKTREVPAGEAPTLADVKALAATLGAKGRQNEAEATPVHQVTESIGADTDSERAIRWLLALMMLCCDPPARARTAARQHGIDGHGNGLPNKPASSRI